MSKRKEVDLVEPNPTITCRRTGEVTQFGARRAFDGAYVLEVLAASGCWNEDFERALFVLQPLIENNCGEFTVKQIAGLLKFAHERLIDAQHAEFRAMPIGTSVTINNGVMNKSTRVADAIASAKGENVIPFTKPPA